jgi:hypothetical protein
MQKLSYLGQVTLVLTWIRVVLTQVYKNYLTLTYPPNVNI